MQHTASRLKPLTCRITRVNFMVFAQEFTKYPFFLYFSECSCFTSGPVNNPAGRSCKGAAIPGRPHSRCRDRLL
jgi:hypothetical protein